MGILKRVYTDIDEKTFHSLLQRARIEDCFVGLDGKVDIGKLLQLLVESYANGRYTILRVPPAKTEKSKNFNENGWVRAELHEKVI